jgi:hypothetical protein
MLNRWPWIVTVLAVLLVANPIGSDFLYAAFGSNEALSRNIAQPIVFTVIVVLVAAGLLEWWIKRLIRRRRTRPAPLD